MNLSFGLNKFGLPGIPRVSGGEPKLPFVEFDYSGYSPRERG